MSLHKNCGWWKNSDCIFEFSVKSYITNTINLSCAKILLPSVICCNNLYSAGGEGLMLHVVLGCETWIYHLNPNTWGGRWRLYGIPRKKKFTSVLSAWNIMVAVSWDEKDVILMNFLPKRTKLNSDQYAERLMNLNAHLHWVHSTIKIYELLPLYDSAKPHTSVHTAEAITNSGYIVAASTLQSWPCVVRLSSVWSFDKNKPVKTPLFQWQGLQNVMHQWLQGREGGREGERERERERAAVAGWEYILLFRGGRRISAVIETTLENICTFSNVGLIFYGKILRCQTYK